MEENIHGIGRKLAKANRHRRKANDALPNRKRRSPPSNMLLALVRPEQQQLTHRERDERAPQKHGNVARSRRFVVIKSGRMPKRTLVAGQSEWRALWVRFVATIENSFRLFSAFGLFVHAEIFGCWKWQKARNPICRKPLLRWAGFLPFPKWIP